MAEDKDGRARVVEELRRVREEVRSRALVPGSPLPAPAPVKVPGPLPADPLPSPVEPPRPPDNAALNSMWEAPRLAPSASGWRGLLLRLLRPVLGPALDRQVDWNSRQVQFDNALLGYLEERFAATHRHYDAVLGIHGRHLGEIDERHLILQEELVAHVHDLVARIDLVLGEAERGRASLEFTLRDVRQRLAALEGKLRQG